MWWDFFNMYPFQAYKKDLVIPELPIKIMLVLFLGKPIKQENNDILQKYYDSITKAVLGNDLKLMKVGNSQTTGQASIPEIQNHKK